MDSGKDSGQHQNIARASAVISVLAENGAQGMRLTDVVAATGLGKATAHRILTGLTSHQLAEYDDFTGRFFVGMKILSWAASAADRFSLVKLTQPSLFRLCKTTQDTVYLTMLANDTAVCMARHEGSFPIKALTLKVGDVRPLGVGSGSLALLSALPDDEVDRVIAEQSNSRSSYPFDDIKLRQMIEKTRKQGYSFNDQHTLPGLESIQGMSAVALPILRTNGSPIGAISVTAISERLTSPRRETVLAAIRQETDLIQSQLQVALSNPATAQILQTRLI